MPHARCGVRCLARGSRARVSSGDRRRAARICKGRIGAGARRTVACRGLLGETPLRPARGDPVRIAAGTRLSCNDGPEGVKGPVARRPHAMRAPAMAISSAGAAPGRAPTRSRDMRGSPDPAGSLWKVRAPPAAWRANRPMPRGGKRHGAAAGCPAWQIHPEGTSSRTSPKLAAEVAPVRPGHTGTIHRTSFQHPGLNCPCGRCSTPTIRAMPVVRCDGLEKRRRG